MSVIKYKAAYADLGDERVQQAPRGLSQTVTTKIVRGKKIQISDADQFWELRKDENWTALPGFRRWNRKLRAMKFIARIGDILVNLEPGTNFNPTTVWEKELEKERQEQIAALNTGGAEKAVVLKKEDKIKMNNLADARNKALVDETTLIRNSYKDSNALPTLLSKIRKVSLPETRGFLYVQILFEAQAIFLKNGDKRLLYETLWAIDNIELPSIKAPKADKKLLLCTEKKSGLVYDGYDHAGSDKSCPVKKLLKDCRAVMSKEPDMVKLQLVEMSDSLPPLSRFTFGYKLDVWQKRVLKWIDAGKSVVICAPTSSGKTVLSSYVAKSTAEAIVAGTAAKKRVQKGPSAGGGSGATAAAAADGDDDDEGDDEGDDWEDLDVGSPVPQGDAEEEEGEAGEDDDEDDDENEAMYSGSGAGPTLKRAVSDSTGAGSRITSTPVTNNLVQQDREKRSNFLSQKLSVEEGVQRVLFVVPTEPLVWQVAAYFTKLLREGGNMEAKIAIVTDQLIYYPPKKFDVMPQIVVGTPLALEDALTKSRGLVGKEETHGKARGDFLPGGFDHFDWVIYDEVHALDGEAGSALQRLIRAMSCKFLALSATVGNAEELRGWMEQVKGEQAGSSNIEAITVTPAEVTHAAVLDNGLPTPPPSVAKAAAAKKDARPTAPPVPIKLRVVRTVSAVQCLLTIDRANCSVQSLKQLICEQVFKDLDSPQNPSHTRYQIQVFFGNTELSEDSMLVDEYGVFADAAVDVIPTVYVRSLVHALNHQGRFINLQRYQWDSNKATNLETINPLAAVESVEDLKNGVLSNSSLSFTSRDSYKLWDKIKSIYPAEAVAFLDPYNFFGARERLTLQRTKDYEDLVKAGLSTLATNFPRETQELLFSFRIDDPSKEFDICDVIFELKKRDMLPCLPFHLNTFEAIKLFQQLLLGLEWRQKRAHPTYHMDQEAKKKGAEKANEKAVKSTGQNEKEKEEQMRSGEIQNEGEAGSVDPYAPHPDFTFSSGSIPDKEITDLVEEMEQFDGFEKRSQDAMKQQRGRNEQILSHALIRGLRRGIGLFINEVSFPSYRRAVQKLASKGKLNVVISDDSLAFGVNMPFRTCVFCGEMFEQLDELMAQQMSGRAGRRGLDTKGNLVYAGQRASHVRRIMIGKIANITGEQQNPKYESMILQPVLSPRHVGWARGAVLGKDTLQEYIEKHHAGSEEQQNTFLWENKVDSAVESYTMSISRQCMVDLKFIVEEGGKIVPNAEFGSTYALLSLIWMMRHQMHESVTVGLLFPTLIDQFNEMLAGISFREKKDNTDKVFLAQNRLYTVFVLMIDRTPYDPEKSLNRLDELNYFQHYPDNMDFLREWEGLFAEAQGQIPERWAHLRDPVPPGTPLDGTLMRCLLDRAYVHTLPEEVKQVVKEKFWRAGNVLKAMNNCCWPELAYFRVAFFLFRGGFASLRYLNSEMIRAVTNFEDMSSADRESRTDKDRDATERLALRPYKLWCDNHNTEEPNVFQNSWSTAMLRAKDRAVSLRGQSKTAHADFLKIIDSFGMLQYTDKNLLVLLVDLDLADAVAAFSTPNMKLIAEALSTCSFARNVQKGLNAGTNSTLGKELCSIGATAWFCDVILQTIPNSKWSARFPMILMTMLEEGYVNSETLSLWYSLPYEVQWLFTPSADQHFLENHMCDAAAAVAAAVPSPTPEPSAELTAALVAAAAGANGARAAVPAAADAVISAESIAALTANSKMFIAWLDAQAGDDDEEEEEDSDEDDE